MTTGERAGTTTIAGAGADIGDTGFIQPGHIRGCSVWLQLGSSDLAILAGQAFQVPHNVAFKYGLDVHVAGTEQYA